MKWKFFVIAFLSVYNVISQISHTNNQSDDGEAKSNTEKSCFIPFNKYAIGMEFYFPKINEKDNHLKRLTSYKYISNDKKPAPDVYYHQISGKIFKIDSIQDRTSEDIHGQVISPNYRLKSKDNIIVKYPYYVENLRDTATKTKVTLILPEAVSLDEVDKFKQQYLNNVFFANFPLKEKKYRKITVIDVTPGTKDKPIRVFFSYDYQKTETINGIETKENTVEKDSIDVCDCGTNILPALIPNCKFINFLLTKDPKINLTDNDLFWDAIMGGKILIGMNENQVIAALGKPSKIETVTKKTELTKTEPVKAKSSKVKSSKAKNSKAEKADGQKENVPKEIKIVKTMTYKNNIVVLENETVKSTKKIE